MKKFGVPKGVSIKTFCLNEEASAIMIGIQRTDTEHGLFVKGRQSLKEETH
jgi:hypothetical protein